MRKSLTEKVSFDFIRYANCWEDADVLLKGLNLKPRSKILSIGSAGDNSFSLLTTQPDLVVAVDVNKIQLYLIELKRVCIEHLEYENLLEFLGFKPSTNREETFNQLKGYLALDVKSYWESNMDQISAGIISQGKFEKYFQLFSRKILPWIHSSKTTEALLSPKTAEAQKEFYDKDWNTWRWRLLFKIFFSKYVMGKFGRDPEFLTEVKVPVGDFIFNKAGEHLQSVYAQNNFILRYNLTGNFGNLLPHYLQKENYDLVKTNLHKLKIKEGYAEAAFEEYGRFDAMNLSNIFEYMPMDLFKKTAEQLIHNTNSGGRLAYWNLMVPRKISEHFAQEVAYLKERSEDLTKIDKGFFYKQVIFDQVL
jgi:S-adenosylmethionine-diacylglycerol 3-amino-3-carboxypropyl transferase